MTKDDANNGAMSHQYTWDAEGRQLTATTVTVGTAYYTYDGDGNRVKQVAKSFDFGNSAARPVVSGPAHL